MKAPDFEWRFLAPKFWPIWLLLPFLYLMAVLPWFIQKRLGDGIGWLAWHLVAQRRDDTLVNLRLCFPEWDDARREQVARAVFYNSGRAIFETALAWFRPKAMLRQRIRFEGMELLRAAKAKGRGVLLLGAHYTSLDMGGALCCVHEPVDTVFRPQNNELFEYISQKCRGRFYHRQINHDSMRSLVRAFKEGDIVWYTPDQDYGLKQGVFAPFFGIEAATITATSRLARINNSVVMFVQFEADEDGMVVMRFEAGPDNYPSGDDVADATRVNQQIEAMIRRCPEQYMWYHRRFKTRPPGEPVPYIKKRREIREAKALAAKAANENAGKNASKEQS